MTNAPCCPPGSWPQLLIPKDELNQDEPKSTMGSVVTVTVEGGGNSNSILPIYIVEPAPSSTNKKSLGSIMVLPDIFSIRVLSENNVCSGDRIGLICDVLAQARYTVALPSIFRDKPFDVAVAKPGNGNFIGFDCFGQQGGVDWFKEQTYDKVGADVKTCAKFLSEKTHGQPLGVVGICYGSWLLAKASTMGDVDFACAIGYHPSTKLEAYFGGDEMAMLNGIKMPPSSFRQAMTLTYTTTKTERERQHWKSRVVELWNSLICSTAGFHVVMSPTNKSSVMY